MNSIILSSLFFLTTVNLTANNIQARVLEQIFELKSPVLIIFGPKSEIAKIRLISRSIFDSDSLIDFRLRIQILEEGNQSGSETSGLRKQFGLATAAEAPEAWVLLGSTGNVLLAGQTLPSSQPVINALESAGERNPVVELRAFLKSHPDHLEARRDLVQLLKRRLLVRLQEQPFNKVQELAPEVDVRLWGEFAQEVDFLLREYAVGFLPGGLQALLPGPGTPERSSPIMKAIYQRHRPGLIAWIHRLPEFGGAWIDLLRIDRVLEGNLLLPTLQNVVPFQTPSHDWHVPYHFLADRVFSDAKKTGQWRPAAEVLQLLWEGAGKNNVKFAFVAGIGPERREPTPTDLYRRDSDAREAAWTKLLAPLIEARLRGGEETSILCLIASLDGTWPNLDLGVKLEKLAKSLGRMDLVHNWKSAAANLGTRVPSDGMFAGEFRVFLQHQDLSLLPQPAEWRYGQPFRQEGIYLELLDVPLAWKTRLGWMDGMPRWALVDWNGLVVLQGEKLPPAQSLLRTFLDAKIPTARNHIEAFLQKHPGRLFPTALQLENTQMRAQTHKIARESKGPPNSGWPDMEQQERLAWQSALVLLDQLTADPLGMHPWLMQFYRPFLLQKNRSREGLVDRPLDQIRALREQSRELLPPQLGAGDFTRKILPRIEFELGRRPNDLLLWRAWLDLASIGDQSVLSIMQKLTPSPLLLPGSWPAPVVIEAAIDALLATNSWDQVVKLLEPRWQAEKTRLQLSMNGGTEAASEISSGWSWHQTRAWVEAHLRLGKPQEANEVLEVLSASGSRPGHLGDLGALARSLGHIAWAEKWTSDLQK